MKRCICHHWIPPTECYVLGAPRIRWGGVREALGGPGGPWGVGSCKVYAPVNPHTKYMRITGQLGKEAKKKNDKNYPLQWSNRRAAGGTLSGIDPRPFLEISAQDQLRSKGTKKNSRMAAVSMRSAGGRVQEPPCPHLQFRYPHCVPILISMVLDRSHNLRMVREGRTKVTIILV